jgi:hypothetical protein
MLSAIKSISYLTVAAFGADVQVPHRLQAGLRQNSRGLLLAGPVLALVFSP